MPEGDNKRELPAPEVNGDEGQPEAKKARLEESTPDQGSPSLEVDLGKVKRQVEYYLSDDNLKFDKFFHERISANAEGWLPFVNILSCRRIQNLGATAEDIVKALVDSTAVDVKEIAPNEWAVRRKNNTPLPSLEERPPRPNRGGDGSAKRGDNSGRNKKSRPADLHVGGCIIKISDIPAEASWELIKTKIQEKLPRQDIEVKGEDGKRGYLDRAIQFVSTPDTECSCYALMGKFENDQEFFMSFEPLDINGARVVVTLLQDADEANNFIRSLPMGIRKRRERDIVNRKNQMAKKPIFLGGIEWQDMDHLRESLKGVLKSTAPGQTTNSKTKNVLIELLKYHPNGANKLRNHVDFKVDVISKEKDTGKDVTKCFWVVREDGTTEDFSLQKCFNHMSMNPPFVEKKEASPSTASTNEATPTAAGTSQMVEAKENIPVVESSTTA